MPYTIFWSTEAELSYLKILEYLEEKWTEREIEKFINRTDEVIDYIINNPFQYQRIKHNTHKAVLNRQVSLFYKIDESNVFLQFFWDNRRDPKNLKL
jgi:hypothetical protein